MGLCGELPDRKDTELSIDAHVLVIANLHKAGAESLASDIIDRLRSEGSRVELFAFSGKPARQPDLRAVSLIITLGGDGTVLYSARLAAPAGIPVLPVNLGRLGFIAWVQPAAWYDSLAAALNGKLSLSSRIMLSIVVKRAGRRLASFTALNDGVISGSGPAKLVNLGISVEGSSLGTYRSDGIIVATPTGSTAYSLAAGGPVVNPDMAAMLFTPICPFTLSNRPLVLPSNETLEVLVESGQREQTLLTVDGQDFFDLAEGDRVSFSEAPNKVRIYCAGPGMFLRVLRAKLNWSGGPDA